MHSRDCNTGKRNRTSTITAVVILMVEVRLTMEEYEALIRAEDLVNRGLLPSKVLPKSIRKKKRVGKPDPKMAKALRKANALGRKKSGGFKKGYSQAKIMKKAHQLRRKM